LASSDVTVLVVAANPVRFTSTILTANQRVETKCLRQADVTVRTGHSRWTNTLTSAWITQTAGTLTA